MNTHEHEITDTRLNAFIDNELDATEHRRILQAIQTDDALSTRVCELRQLRALVQSAYRTSPQLESHTHKRTMPLPVHAAVFPRSIAAGVLVMLCLGGGWFAHGVFDSATAPAIAIDEQSFQAVRIDRAAGQGHDVLLHVNSGDPTLLASALDTAERVARDHHGPSDHVIILANDSGLNLLRADVSPYPDRIRALLSAHPNITLIACRNAMEKLEAQTGTKITLLPGASVGRTAIDEIVARLRDGWLYVKV